MTLDKLARGKTLVSDIAKLEKFIKELSNNNKSIHLGVPYEGGFADRLTPHQSETIHTLALTYLKENYEAARKEFEAL